MNLFTKLFKPKASLPEVIINDSDFGELKYDHDGGWDSIFVFHNEDVGVGVAADINGPTKVQKNIWKGIKERITTLNDSSESLIRNEIINEWPTEYQSNKLTLFQIDIYSEKHHAESQFIMCYFLEGDDDGIHRVEYMDFKPLYYGRDD